MQGVTIVDHPLVQHKLTLIRDKTISTKSFRELLKEIGMLLCYEVTRDLPLTEVEIETPLARMQSAKISGKKLVFVPVLRAGVTFVDGMLDLVPTARVAHIGLYREPQTFVAVEYFFKSPSDLQRATCDRGVAGTGNGEHGGGGGRPAEGARRPRHSDGVPARSARRRRAFSGPASRRAAMDRRHRPRAGRECLHSAWSRRRRRSRLRDALAQPILARNLLMQPAACEMRAAGSVMAGSSRQMGRR